MGLLDLKTDWPAASDILAFLSGTGLFSGPLAAALSTLDTSGEVEIELASAVQTIQDWTGWTPFLAAAETRTFDPPGPEKGPVGLWAGLANVGGSTKLFLHAGLLSLTNGTITTGLTATNPTGTVLTLGKDFWLRPSSAPQYKRPFTQVEFRTIQYGEPQSISISGVWGFAAGIPPPVFRAAVKLAGAALAPQIDLLINNGLAAIDGIKFAGTGDSAVNAAAAQWRADAEMLITRGNYRRISL